MGLRDLFRRGDSDAVKDPFSGGSEDFYDEGESRFAGKGPKIALAASGVLFLALVGGVAAIFMTGDKTASTVPMTGSFADLQVEEDAATPAAAPGAAPAAKAPVIADATAATDRSVSRRPWLETTAAPAAATPPRLGVTDTTPPKGAITPVTPPAAKTPPAAAPAPPVKVAEAPKAPEAKPAAAPATAAKPAEIKTAEAKPTETKPAETKPGETKPAATTAAATKPAETKTAGMMAPPAATTPSMPAGTAMKPVSLPPSDMKIAEDVVDPTKDIGGIPALKASGEVPGAPRLYDLPKGADTGPAVAGGRPRLVEPPLPPTDKIAVAAPPPRYASLTDVKKDAAPPAATGAKVAFVVDGLGLSQSATDAAINKLPASVTLAFSPYARDLKKWMEKAKAKGHEVLIEVPMESKQFPADDPGPLGLLTSAEPKENQERLETILKASAGAIGVLDDMGSKFRESGEHINPFFARLKQSNLFYVQGTPGVRVGEATVPTAISDVVIDERPFRAAIDARLDYAERLAKYQGSAVASVSAKPVSFERLVLWLEQAQKKGVTLAPISQVLIKQ